MSVIIHSRLHRTDSQNRPLLDIEASILGYHYISSHNSCETNTNTNTYSLQHSGRKSPACESAAYTIYSGNDSRVTRWHGAGETPEQYRVSMYGDVTCVYRMYAGGKVAAYSIVHVDSGESETYRLSITGKAFAVLFPGWGGERVKGEVARAFDIGVLLITVRREADEAWEAVEGGMDEDEEFLAYEFVEAGEASGMKDGFIEVGDVSGTDDGFVDVDIDVVEVACV